jgi:uncharacterized protein (TIGR03086 family)
MDPKELLAKAIQQATTCINMVRDEHWNNATPCSEWNLRQLVNHMVYELLWVPDLLLGKTVAEVGDTHDGDVLYSDPHAAWQHAADAALVASKHADPEATVHLSYGDKLADDYLQEVGADMMIHGWDVGRSLKCSVVFEPALAQAVFDNSLPRREEFARSGSFGEPFDPGEEAPLEVRLLGLFGRHPEVEP